MNEKKCAYVFITRRFSTRPKHEFELLTLVFHVMRICDDFMRSKNIIKSSKVIAFMANIAYQITNPIWSIVNERANKWTLLNMVEIILLSMAIFSNETNDSPSMLTMYHVMTLKINRAMVCLKRNINLQVHAKEFIILINGFAWGKGYLVDEYRGASN